MWISFCDLKYFAVLQKITLDKSIILIFLSFTEHNICEILIKFINFTSILYSNDSF